MEGARECLAVMVNFLFSGSVWRQRKESCEVKRRTV